MRVSVDKRPFCHKERVGTPLFGSIKMLDLSPIYLYLFVFIFFVEAWLEPCCLLVMSACQHFSP